LMYRSRSGHISAVLAVILGISCCQNSLQIHR
jgi:hypothetical protein